MPPIPNLKLAEHAFVLTQDRCTDRHDSAREALMAGIEKDGEHSWAMHTEPQC